MANHGTKFSDVSLIILGAWATWKHHDSCIFEGVFLEVQTVVCAVFVDVDLWTAGLS